MEIYLFQNFIKKENSTKQPDISTGKMFSCTLKTPSSVVNPSVLIEHAVLNYFFKYNYAYIPDFERYYFVDDITSEGLLWKYTMHCDVLASYKNKIENAPLYILRSSAVFNGKIADNYYPVTFEHKTFIRRYDTLWNILTNNTGNDIKVSKGSFIIGIVAVPAGTGAGSYGSIRYYALEQADLLALVTQLLTNTITENNLFSINDATLALQKSLINPLSYIKSCIWIPIDKDILTGSDSTTLNVWEWTLSGITNKVLTSDRPYYKTGYIGFRRHQHPQAAARGKYLNASPYSRISLLYPPFGLFDIDTSVLIDSDELAVELTMDYITGLGTLDIESVTADSEMIEGSESRYNLLQRIKSQIGVSIQLSEVGYDYSNMGLNLIGGAAELIQSSFGSYLDSTISNAVSQIGTAVNAMRTKASTIGSNGGFSELGGDAILFEEFFLVADEDLGHIGRPLCRILMLKNNNTGYYLAREGDIEIPHATFPELTAVKAYLESGFYYE